MPVTGAVEAVPGQTKSDGHERTTPMSSSVLTFAAESGEHAAQGLSPIGFGVVTFAILVSLLLATLALRSLNTRQRKR